MSKRKEKEGGESTGSFFAKKPKIPVDDAKDDASDASTKGQPSSPEQRQAWTAELRSNFLYENYPDSFFDLWYVRT